MKRVNVRELHHDTGALVDLAAQGHVVVILKRGIPVAELHPSSSSRVRRTLPDRTELLSRFPAVTADSGRYLEEDRS
jgi:antitoxin (DNA-binding transcriptional repressor) of toxin-antitoxin stability system